MLPKLIVLSGPLGSGKSTLAKKYVEDHPLALALDIDIIRAMLGQWRERPEESALLTKKLAEHISREHLISGYDVIIPQIYRKGEYLDSLKNLAHEAGAEYFEVLLDLPKDEAIERFMSYKGIRPGGLIDRGGGVDKLASMYDEMVHLAESRHDTIRVVSLRDDVDKTYSSLIKHLS